MEAPEARPLLPEAVKAGELLSGTVRERLCVCLQVYISEKLLAPQRTSSVTGQEKCSRRVKHACLW